MGGSDKQGRATLTHVDSTGRAKMVDVGDKPATKRSATAAARVLLGPTAFQVIPASRERWSLPLHACMLLGGSP